MSVEIKKNNLLPIMTSTLTSNGNPVDLTTAVSVKFIMVAEGTAPGGSPKINAAAAFDADRTSGRVSYSWAGTDTDTAGIYRAEWEVMWPGSKKQTFPGRNYLTVLISQGLL